MDITGDVVNACFEGGGAILAWINVRRILRDRKVMGVSPWVTAFWSAWGIWNIPYYFSLGQDLSALAAGNLALANSVWVLLCVHYSRNPTPQ